MIVLFIFFFVRINKMTSIEFNNKKAFILKNLLEKTFSSLNYLEKRTEIQLNNLDMTDKQFKHFEHNIHNLLMISRENSIRKKSDNKERKTTNNPQKKMIRSKTSNHFQKNQNNKNELNNSNNYNYNNNYNNLSNNSLNSSIGRSSTNKINMISQLSTLSSRKNSRNSVAENYNKNNKKQDLRSKSLHTSRFIDTNESEFSTSLKKKNYKSLKNELESPKFKFKEPLDFKFEISNIQEQIKYVENTLNNTEKILYKKSLSSEMERKTKLEANLNHFFEEKSLMILKNILIFCNIEDGMNLVSLNKKFCKEGRVKYIHKIIKTFDERQIDQNIEEIKEKYNNELNENFPKFQLSKGALRAIEVLNEEIYLSIFYNDELPKKYFDILIIYKLFALLIKKEELIQIIDNNEEFWRKISDYFITEGKNKLGDFILNLIDDFSFDEENLNKMRKMVNKYKSKISPSYYTKICGTTSLIVFILKDALEYCGILINERKTPIKRIYENLIREKEIINRLKNMKKEVQNM